MKTNEKKLCCMAVKLLGWIFALLSAYFFFFMLSAAYTIGTDMVWALEGTDAYTQYTFEVIGELAGGWVIMILGFVLARLCFRLARRMSRRRREMTFSEQQAVASPFILYLRSFYADAVTSRSAERLLKPEQTEEQLLVSILDDIAPVIAIGRPHDTYLPKGADRLYLSDEVWQERVTELAHSAELVALRLGSTRGFWWEVSLCLEQLPPDKLLFIIPALKDPAPMEELERRLLAHGIDADLSRLKVKKRGKSSIAGFLTIGEDNKAVFTPIKRRPLLDVFIPAEDTLREALADLLRANGGYASSRSVAVRAKVCWGIVLVSFFIMAANSYLKYQEFERDRYPKELIALCESSVYTPEQLKGLSDQGKIHYIFTDILKGAGKMDKSSALELYQLTTGLLETVSDREYQLLFQDLPDDIADYPTDLLIVAKRYFTDEGYDLYLHYLMQGAAAGSGGTAPDYEPLAPDVQEELIRRLEQDPQYDEIEQSLSAAHHCDMEVRRLLLQMYQEGYSVESVLWAKLIF